MKKIFKVLGIIIVICASVLIVRYLFSDRMFFYAYEKTIMGLNYWPKIGVLGFVAAILAGRFQYDRVGRRRYNERMFIVVAIPFAGAAAALLFVEGYESVVQMLNGSLSMDDSPWWPIVLAPYVCMFIGIIYFFVLAYLGAIVGESKRLQMIRRRFNR